VDRRDRYAAWFVASLCERQTACCCLLVTPLEQSPKRIRLDALPQTLARNARNMSLRGSANGWARSAGDLRRAIASLAGMSDLLGA